MLANSSGSNSNPEAKQPSTTIYIQFCHNCDSHLFTVKHQEQKYLNHFEHTKKYLEEKGIIVKKKHVPQQLYKRSPYCPPNVYYRDNGDIVYFPQIGSFEVYLADTKIFSKLETNKWPAPEHIYSIVNKKQPQQHKDRYGQLASTEHAHIKEKLESSNQAKTIGQKASKSYHLKWPRLQSDRYSLERRNLLNRSQNKQNKTARGGAHSFGKRVQIQQKPQTDRIGQTKIAKPQLEGLPVVENKNKASKANVYLEPIYPKTNVNLENYQRYRMAYSRKIHEEKLAYEIEKAKKDAEVALNFKEKISRPKRPRLVINTLKDSASKQPNILITPHHQEKKQEPPCQASSKEPQDIMKNSLELPKQEKEQAEWKLYKRSSENEPQEKEKKDSSAPEPSAAKVEAKQSAVQISKAKQVQQIKGEKQIDGAKADSMQLDLTKTHKVEENEVRKNSQEDNYQQQSFEDLPENKVSAQQAANANHLALQTEEIREGEEANNRNLVEIVVPSQNNPLGPHNQKQQELLSQKKSAKQISPPSPYKEDKEPNQNDKGQALDLAAQPTTAPQQSHKQNKISNHEHASEYPNEYQKQQNNQYAQEQFDKEQENANKLVEKAQL